MGILNMSSTFTIPGLVLGDGSLGLYAVNPNLEWGHKLPQKPFLTFKVRELEKQLGCKKPIKIKEGDVSYVHNGEKKWTRRCRATKQSPKLWDAYNLLYPEGEKVYTNELLYSLTNGDIAIWFMDDGSLSLAKPDSKDTWEMILCIDCPIDQALVVLNFFKQKFNIEFRLSKSTINKKTGIQQYRLFTGRKANIERFMKIVEPTIMQVPTMWYKSLSHQRMLRANEK